MLLLFACTVHGISFCSALQLALVFIVWCLVVPFNFVEAYLTFLKVIVLILKHTTLLRLSLLPGPALIQADLDYQQADVDQRIQQYIGTSQRPSAELDKDFIMAIEIGSVCLFLPVQIIQSLYFQFQV